MSVFDPFHHDHINTPVNTPLITPLNFRWLGGGCRMKTGGGYNPPGGGLDKSLILGRAVN